MTEILPMPKGPFSSPEELEDRKGVYNVYYRDGDNFVVIDLAVSDKVKTYLETSYKKEDWEKYGGKYRVYVSYRDS